MDLPLITVITVCFNAKKDLRDTIENVLNLEYKNLDYIVIDGGSTDGTVELLESYGDKIKLWKSEKDKGIYDAMNKGWALADESSHIIFLGAGDKLIKLPNEPLESSCVYYGDVLIGVDRKFISKSDWRINLGNTLHHQALLVPKCLYPNNPFSLEYNIYSDFDFNLRLYNTKGVKFVRCEKLLGFAKPDGVSAQLNINEMSAVVKNRNGYIFYIASIIYLHIQKIRFFLGKFNA